MRIQCELLSIYVSWMEFMFQAVFHSLRKRQLLHGFRPFFALNNEKPMSKSHSNCILNVECDLITSTQRADSIRTHKPIQSKLEKKGIGMFGLKMVEAIRWKKRITPLNGIVCICAADDDSCRNSCNESQQGPLASVVFRNFILFFRCHCFACCLDMTCIFGSKILPNLLAH